MLISRFDTRNIHEVIKRFEEKHNFKIPKQYKSFLEKYNGGITPDTDFKICKVSADICGFYGFETTDENFDYSSIEHTISFSEFLADHMLPIGTSSFGDDILLGIGSDNNGKIYYHYHDRKKSYKELTEVFKTFVGKCKSKRIGHIETIEERKQMMRDRGFRGTISPAKLSGWQAEIDYYSKLVQEEVNIEE